MALTAYFLAGWPSIKLFAYRLVPRSRRPRVIPVAAAIRLILHEVTFPRMDHS